MCISGCWDASLRIDFDPHQVLHPEHPNIIKKAVFVNRAKPIVSTSKNCERKKSSDENHNQILNLLIFCKKGLT